MTPLLDFGTVTSFAYSATDVTVVLTPEQQALLVNMVQVFTDNRLWFDYPTNSDDIDAAVADLLTVLVP